MYDFYYDKSPQEASVRAKRLNISMIPPEGCKPPVVHSFAYLEITVLILDTDTPTTAYSPYVPYLSVSINIFHGGLTVLN